MSKMPMLKVLKKKKLKNQYMEWTGYVKFKEKVQRKKKEEKGSV
jgi:hypothetical protein